MNIFLMILTGIAGLIALLFIIGLFSKKGYDIERQITIQKSPQTVFDYVKYLKNQDHFNLWVMKDPAMRKEFKGVDGTGGFIYAWDGNNKAGAGEQEIKKIAEGKRVDMEIRFKRPFKGIADSYIETGTSGTNSTNVKWAFSSQMHYPMNIMLLFMSMDRLLGKDIESSLKNLKTILEKS